MSVAYLKSQTGFDTGGSGVSTSGTGGEIVKTGVGKGTDTEGGTVSEIVTGTCEEKYEIDSKNVT